MSADAPDTWEDLFGRIPLARSFLRVVIRGSQGPVRLDIPVVNKLETFDIATWAMTSGQNYIALSSVQGPEDVIECRTQYCDPIMLVSMIELTWNFEFARFDSVCFDNFDAILQESDGIVITHSGIDMELQDVLLQKAKTAGKWPFAPTIAPSTRSLWRGCAKAPSLCGFRLHERS